MPTYVTSVNLEPYFVDKDTGEPLSNGYIQFWVDSDRTTPKAIWQKVTSGTDPVTGNPVYTFVELPNPLHLSSVGTIEDANGNNIALYYNPFDDAGNVELYYVEVFNSLGVPQFTREGWPDSFATSGGGGGGSGTVTSVTIASNNTPALAVTNPTITGTGTIILTPHGNLLGFQIFTTGTAATYTKPTNVNSILVECVGAGGGGGGAGAGVGLGAGGGGGGGGSYARLWIPGAAATYTYTVGVGGAGGAAGNNRAGNGTATTFDTITAGGGGGGGGGTESIMTYFAAVGEYGNPTAATGGDVNVTGGSGDSGFICSQDLGLGGQGGASIYGNGAGETYAFFGPFSTNGANANDHGGGGAGGATNNSTIPASGGNGGGGLIIVWEYS